MGEKQFLATVTCPNCRRNLPISNNTEIVVCLACQHKFLLSQLSFSIPNTRPERAERG